MSAEILEMYKPDFQKPVDHLKEDLKALRTGRATPALVEDIQVEVYGARTPILGLASISVPDNRTLTVEPWDKSVIKEIEKAIIDANIGLNPNVQGTLIRLALPTLTEETRKDLIKIMNDKLEHARITIRNVRERTKGDVVEAEKAKEITEDDKYRLLEQLDKRVGEWNDKIRSIGEEKEKEIMTI